MKFNFQFNLSAESAKIAGDSYSGELGKVDCPIELTVELEAGEAAQAIGLLKEALKAVPEMIKQQAKESEDLENLRANNAERLERLKAQLAGETADRQRAAEEKAKVK
jgi:hypothetical protein